MSKSQHGLDDELPQQNQNNRMSDDPADGNRESFVTGKDGVAPVEKAPPAERQDQSTIEAFGEEGAGVGAKE